MSISAVPSQTRAVKLPDTKQQWVSILRAISLKPYQWHSGVASKLLAMFEQPQVDCAVHCECSLIQHLGIKDGSEWDNVPPFPYIGVSKLSCSACYLWIKAFNKLGGCKFYTRGSHGKWCWAWGMAEVEGVRKGLVKKVCDEYRAHLQERALLRSDSDSDGPDSSEGAKPAPCPAHKTFFRSKVNSRVQKYGGHGRDQYEELPSLPRSHERIAKGV